MTAFKFFSLLILTGVFHLFSFMGIAFAFAGIDRFGVPDLTAKILGFFVNLGDVLLKMHLILAPLFYVVTIGVFFFGPRPVAYQLAKWSWVLPATSFAVIFLFFFIMARMGK